MNSPKAKGAAPPAPWPPESGHADIPAISDSGRDEPPTTVIKRHMAKRTPNRPSGLGNYSPRHSPAPRLLPPKSPSFPTAPLSVSTAASLAVPTALSFDVPADGSPLIFTAASSAKPTPLFSEYRFSPSRHVDSRQSESVASGDHPGAFPSRNSAQPELHSSVTAELHPEHVVHSPSVVAIPNNRALELAYNTPPLDTPRLSGFQGQQGEKMIDQGVSEIQSFDTAKFQSPVDVSRHYAVHDEAASPQNEAIVPDHGRAARSTSRETCSSSKSDSEESNQQSRDNLTTYSAYHGPSASEDESDKDHIPTGEIIYVATSPAGRALSISSSASSSNSPSPDHVHGSQDDERNPNDSSEWSERAHLTQSTKPGIINIPDTSSDDGDENDFHTVLGAATPFPRPTSALSIFQSSRRQTRRASGHNHEPKPFDSNAFDGAIYQQSGAAPPPAGVMVTRRTADDHATQGVQQQRGFVHANPAIHLMHNRPKSWFLRKNAEIRARGNRKRWFGRVGARLRFIRFWKRKEESKRKDALRRGQLPEQIDPQPRTFSRPLDFGLVPESELPEEVLQNSGWKKACAFFRENRRLRDSRRQDLRRCEEETNEYLMMLEQGQGP